MRAYCIFDDFPVKEINRLQDNGIEVDVLEQGKERPNPEQMKSILEKYEIAIIGTSQKIKPDMWNNVSSPRIIGTVSVGTDHIEIQDGKAVTVLNTPSSNAQSVAEYILGCALMCRKRFAEANMLYMEGKNNKALSKKPEDICGTVVGLVGAGHIAQKLMELLKPFGVKILIYTKNPITHQNLVDLYGVEFVSLTDLATRSDIVVVAVPNNDTTHNLISADLVDLLKENCVFISIARAEVLDVSALIRRARENRHFYVCLDIDINETYVGMNNQDNIFITPHIGGGTIETRKRMFAEVTERIIKFLQN